MRSIVYLRRAMRSGVAASILFIFADAASAEEHDCQIQEVSGIAEASSNAACLLKKIEALAADNNALRGEIASIELLEGPRGPQGPGFTSGMIAFNILNYSCPQGWRAMGTATVDLRDTGEMLAYLKTKNQYDGVNVSDERAAAPGYDLVKVNLCLLE